ncbi:MAG: hypothetical protein IPK71_00150 [Myxococcales bacterium]|jgi:YD repeat-containing protein|nr:hypothetical protein [Myxococcales bacterium]
MPLPNPPLLPHLTEKRESGITYTYSYDARGRLARVLRNGNDWVATLAPDRAPV